MLGDTKWNWVTANAPPAHTYDRHAAGHQARRAAHRQTLSLPDSPNVILPRFAATFQSRRDLLCCLAPVAPAFEPARGTQAPSQRHTKQPVHVDRKRPIGYRARPGKGKNRKNGGFNQPHPGTGCDGDRLDATLDSGGHGSASRARCRLCALGGAAEIAAGATADVAQ